MTASISSRLDKAVTVLEKLVSFPTISSESNLSLIDYVVDYLNQHEIACHVSRDASGGKANILAMIGPHRAGGIVLSGHTDVVPVEGQPWTTDPFVLRKVDGKLYGRGTADMKGFIACVLASVPIMRSRHMERPIVLSFSYDEEIGCNGVHQIIDALGEAVPKPDLCIVGEPSGMRVINAHKGVRLFSTEVAGADCHSSDPRAGASAVHAAVAILSELLAAEEDLRTRGDNVLSFPVMFDPPYSTLNIGRVAGGTTTNIVARECRVDWELRLLPGQDLDEIPNRIEHLLNKHVRPRLQANHPGCSVETEMLCDVPPLAPESDARAETLSKQLAQTNHTETVSFGSEAGLFQRAGLSTVICGPGEIDEAHKPDEHVTLDQLFQCLQFLDRLIKTL
jgi:acetylornithine deacetylase